MLQTRIYKKRQFLIFDFEDGTTVKYDFATRTAIGKKGRPVKDLKTQLSGLSMSQLIENCDDKKYSDFLRFIKRRYPYDIYNIGTILSKIPHYNHFEQIYSAGLGDIVDDYFNKDISDIPKSLIKIAKEYEFKITSRLCDDWKHNPDAHYIAYQQEYLSLTPKDILSILWNQSYTIGNSVFNILIDTYGYNAKALFLYIDSLKTYEAITDMNYIMRELLDYAQMMKSISNKFDKYPRNFLTTHKIACRNYERLKKEFPKNYSKKEFETITNVLLANISSFIQKQRKTLKMKRCSKIIVLHLI